MSYPAYERNMARFRAWALRMRLDRARRREAGRRATTTLASLASVIRREYGLSRRDRRIAQRHDVMDERATTLTVDAVVNSVVSTLVVTPWAYVGGQWRRLDR